MTIEWRMKVWEPDGTARSTITIDDAVASLTRFSVDKAGGCLEAEWDADPTAVTIKARDVVQLDVSEDSGVTWDSAYKGVVTIAGSARSDGLRSYKAVGLKERFYERLVTRGEVAGDDVAKMVRTVASSVGTSYSIGNIPLQTFTLGDRYPAFESAGALLDELAATVGAFIVPTGETYTYDGVTYNAGDVVPATTWGVNANGAFFFRRPQTASLAVSEGAVDTIVRWESVVAEEVYDRATLVYASELASGELYKSTSPGGVYALWTEGIPIARSFGSGSYEAERLVPLENPLDYMTDAAAVSVNNTWTNVANAFDNDAGTFAQASVAGANELTAVASGHQEGIVRLDYAKAVADTFFSVTLYWYDGTDTLATIAYHFTNEETTERRIAILPALKPAGVDVSAASLYTRVIGADNDRVYRLEIMVPDTDDSGTLSETLAEGYYRDPADDASEVQLVNTLGTVSQTMTLTPDGEAATDLPIERVEFSLTNEDGLVTTYWIGQPYPSELMSQAAVLDRLIERRRS